MESDRFYRAVFYAGGVWNLLASVPTAFLIGSLPTMLQIEPPRYPIFIYFNLMTMAVFGCMHFVVARNLGSARPFVKVLLWSKILTVLVFVAGIAFLAMPGSLSRFLGPGIFVDLIFGSLFWRYLVFSARKLERAG